MTAQVQPTRDYFILREDGFCLRRIIGIGFDIFSPGGGICAFVETESQIEEKIAREKKEWFR